MRSLYALLLLLSTPAFAAPTPETIKNLLESQASCGNMVRFDNTNLYQGFGFYRNALEEPRSAIPGRLQVIPFDGSEAFNLNTKDAAIDLVTEGMTAFVLTYTSIEEWDLSMRTRVAEYETYAIQKPLAYKQHATSFARYKNTLVIAHGRLGVSFFDMKMKRLTNQFRLLKSQLPLESMATSINVQGKYAYVLMDNFHVTKPDDHINIFRGFVIVDIEKQAVVAELGGMDPGATSLVSDSQKMIVSFEGLPIWRYSLSSPQAPQLEERLWKYGVSGHPIGSAVMDEKYYYTCYLKAPTYPGENGGYYKKIPVALDRTSWSLN